MSYRPKVGQSYWMINSRFEVRQTENSGGDKSVKRIRVGNAFKTEQDAKKFREFITSKNILEQKTNFDKRLAFVYGFITAVFLALVIMLVTPANAQQSDKYDGECPKPFTTVGRCADKCPLQTDTLLSYDPKTGAAICKSAPTGCPYGDSIPLGPDCDKHAPQSNTAQPTEDVQNWGK